MSAFQFPQVYATRAGNMSGARAQAKQNKEIDGTPMCLAGLVIGSVIVLAILKASGFRAVVGIGGS